jgi:hypothetical protein
MVWLVYGMAQKEKGIAERESAGQRDYPEKE